MKSTATQTKISLEIFEVMSNPEMVEDIRLGLADIKAGRTIKTEYLKKILGISHN